MQKNIFLLLSACILSLGQVMADNVLTVSNVNVPQDGQATLEIGCEFDTEYTAFQIELSLPDGILLLSDEEGYPIIEKAFDTNHILTGNLLPSNGNYRFTCRSMDNLSIPTNGALFRVTLLADANLSVGINLSACVTACEFTRTADSNGEMLSDVNFTVHITEFRTILDEASTTMPTAENNANVRVKRTIKANEWSTIVLPFAMSEAQVKTAFGDDVKLADFTSWSSEEDDDGNIVSISIGFDPIDAIAANHPCLIKVSSAISDFSVDGVDIDPEDEPTVQVGKKKVEKGFLIGTYVAQTVVPEYNLFLSENEFWYSTGLTKMKAFRAYFELYDVLAEAENSSSAANVRVTFVDESVTGISDIAAKQKKGVYTLQGVALGEKDVKRLPKGMYVVDGKKVVKN